ncbi:sulfatase-like hydrolase/transferase [Thermoleophilia bacterium SCSIO 60948]|nr:sulfatase-like hydrolase/transferase [Thermoleophilia bacterium SCSIO 60948]
MDTSPERDRALTRKQLIGSGAAAAATALLSRATPAAAGETAAGEGASVAGMNVVMFITDQERAVQHFPPNWVRRNLPGMRRLKRNGLSFDRAYTSACMCSPARSSFFTGYMPAQHGVKYTLEEDMPADQYPQVDLPTDLPNMASVMASAGYEVVYKGKWHCSKPVGEEAVPADLERYGFSRWNPPDAGGNQDIDQGGGGVADNDGRFMDQEGNPSDGTEGALQYLENVAPGQQPFFLVISLVNPHDVLFYPKNYEAADYDDSWLEGEIDLPATVDEDLSTKPSVQAEFLRIFNLSGKLKTPAMKRNYLNYYANLMKSSDAYLSAVLDKLEETGLFDDTLIIRTSDHGEMGLTHGGMRQKNFNSYEEATRVPLVFSNPRLYPRAKSTDALVSHIDMLPTLASLVDAPPSARADWEGVDYSSIVEDPDRARPVQDYVMFTYDDYQSGQANGPYPKPPNHLISLRERRWKIALYYDVDGDEPNQWEMYDLDRDPLEKRNIAYPGYRRTAEQRKQFRRLRRKLLRVRAQRLQPLPQTEQASVTGAPA